MSDPRHDDDGDHEKQRSEDQKGKREDARQDDGDGQESDGSDDDGDDDEKDSKPPVYKRPLFWFILIPVVAAIVIGGTLYWLHARKFQSTDDAFVDAHIVRISPEVAGQLIAVADVDNRHVQAGRLLAVVKPTGAQAQRAEAQAGEVSRRC